MRYWLGIIFLLTVGGLAYWLPVDFELIRFTIDQWVVELPLVFFIILLFIACGLFVLLGRFVYWLIKVPVAAKRQLTNLLQQKHLDTLSHLNVLAGKKSWKAVGQQLKKIGSTKDEREVLVLLGVTQLLIDSAHFELADSCLLKCKPAKECISEYLVWLKKIEILLAKKRMDAAAAKIKDLQVDQLPPIFQSVYFILLLKVYWVQKQYDEVVKLVKQLNSQNILDDLNYKGILIYISVRLYQKRYFNDYHAAFEFWNLLPKKIRYLDEVFLGLINCLDDPLVLDSLYFAQDLLVKTIKSRWKSLWVVRFANLKIHMNQTHLDQLINWLRYQPDNPRLLGSVAQVALKVDQLAIAYQYLNKCLSIHPDDRFALYLMSVYCEKKKNYTQALAYRRRLEGGQFDQLMGLSAL